jgi:hypothetical protein
MLCRFVFYENQNYHNFYWYLRFFQQIFFCRFLIYFCHDFRFKKNREYIFNFLNENSIFTEKARQVRHIVVG